MKLQYYEPTGARLVCSTPRAECPRACGKTDEPQTAGALPRRRRTRRESAFTMVEVAISLAVIGFALVAIIGILPAGLNVQKENREETIINQEASLWMNAIRQGAFGLDYLTNYVDLIEVNETHFDENGDPSRSFRFIYTPYFSNPAGYELTNGAVIVGLISAPKFRRGPIDGGFTSNHVEVYTRAVSGSAADKAPQDNQTVRAGAFGYRLTPSVMPLYAISDQWYDYLGFVQATGQGGGGGAQADYARTVERNMQEIRLSFRWPLRPPVDARLLPEQVATNVGPGRLTFRTTSSGSVSNLPPTGDLVQYSWLEPGTYRKGGRR